MILHCLFCHALAYATTANGVCLLLLVPPLHSTASSVHSMFYSIKKVQQLHSKEGGGLIVESGPIFGRLGTYILTQLYKYCYDDSGIIRWGLVVQTVP